MTNLNHWLNLSEQQKKIRIERCYKVLRQVADKQLTLLSKFKKDKSCHKTERHSYFFTIVGSFWEDADFAFALGKKRHSFYAIYPVRTMMEKLLKILWFTNQKASEQDLIAIKELLIQCLHFYRLEKSDENSGEKFESYYKEINNGIFPPIDKVRRNDLKAFPSYEDLCKKSGLRDSHKLYDFYRFLSGLPHGDFLSIFRINAGQKNEEYRRAMMLAVYFCTEMLKVTNFHLGQSTQQDVASAIKRADDVLYNRF